MLEKHQTNNPVPQVLIYPYRVHNYRSIHKSKHTKNEAMFAITNKKDENSRIGLKEVHLGGVMAPSQGGHRKELRAL
jgi:hypothetical protein